MASITDQIIERVKHEANIVDIVGDYVRLRKTGKNWVGLCPFHDDKRPSMHVEPVKGIFKCFSCGEGGNVFTFLMRINGWAFPETVRNLAIQLGIDVPEERDHTNDKDFNERERLVTAMREAATRYHKLLRSDAGEHVLAYFRSRGFSDKTINQFGLGYSPDEWSWLLDGMTASGYSGQELEKAGLVISRSGRDGWYDRFRGRAMFPIFEATGRLVGFGARRMGDDPDQPKYINSPESPIYHKSRVLYGLYQAKQAIRKEGYALFVEGYSDVISLHQAGVETAVATCGTAMAREHTALISRFTNRVILVFDSDEAGERATERGIDVLIEGGLDVAVARLPDGEDPDTFIRKFGADEFRRKIREAHSFVKYRAQLMESRGDFDSPERKSEAIRSLVKTIALIPDKLKRELSVGEVAERFHLEESLIIPELRRITGEAVRRATRLKRPELPPANAEPSADADLPAGAEPDNRGLSIPVKRQDMPPAEFRLVQVLLLGDAQMLEHTFERISPEDFTHPVLREFVDLILAYYVNQRSFALGDLALQELPGSMQQLVAQLAIEQETLSDFWLEKDPEYREPNPWKVARDCLIRIRQEKIEHEYQIVQDKLRETELSEDELRSIFARLADLNTERQELHSLLSGEV